MEKDSELPGSRSFDVPPEPTESPSKFRRSIVLAFVVYAIWVLSPSKGTWFPFNSESHDSSEETNKVKPFSWNEVPSKPYLDYVECYGEFQCARLEVPMDYWNETTNATVSVAVLRKPARVPVTHPQYGGVTLHNPGGPGGSGVGFLLAGADRIREIIDTDDGKGKYFDQLSFDPRGIGLTTPRVHCSHNYNSDVVWTLRLAEQGLFSASDAALSRLWSMASARGQTCSLPVSDEVDVKKYVSTAYVARDMLEIVERHGEWREKEAKSLLQRESHCGGRSIADERSADELLETLKYKKREEKINYWGFSYGSYLGNTFAAMYPERVNRLIVDGVVDAYDYKKALWLDNLVDAERDLGLFYHHCARVGFPRCALANETDKTTEEGVRARLLNITNNLYHNPLPVPSIAGPEIVTYSDVKRLVLGVLYTPLGGFELLADMLYDIEKGHGQKFAEFILRPSHELYCPPCDGRDHSGDETPDVTGDAQLTIACGDGDSQIWMTKEDFSEHLKNVTAISPTIGEVWSYIRLNCIHYSVRPHTRFEGPWIANTSHPILEIGNSADPVTPGRYAKKMAKGFKGAVALIQDSGGHCSISSPSKCTEGYVRKYFQTGELPPEDTICKPDILPFGDEEEVLDAETAELKGRRLQLVTALHASGGGFMNRHFTGSPWIHLPLRADGRKRT